MGNVVKGCGMGVIDIALEMVLVHGYGFRLEMLADPRTTGRLG